MKWEEPASRGRRRFFFFSVARCYDTGEAGHRSQTRWSQGRAGGGSLITVTSWYLPTAGWQHRACTREEKRVGSSAYLNQFFLQFYFSFNVLQEFLPLDSPLVRTPQKVRLSSPDSASDFFSTSSRLDSTSVKFSSLYAASSGSQSAQKKQLPTVTERITPLKVK